MGFWDELGERIAGPRVREPMSLKALVPQIAPRQPARSRLQRRALSRATRQPQRMVPHREIRVVDEIQQAYKSLAYSDYVNDFINNTGFYEGDHYTDQQVEAAYRTSVYLFAVMRRVANLFSEVQIIGEERQDDGTWERLPETHHLNRVFSTAGAQFMRELFLFYAMYGKTLVYKRKTRLARAAYRQGKVIANYTDGGIAGIHIIPNVKWDIDEDTYRSEIIGFRLNEPEEALEAGMRERDEFVYIHDFDFRNTNDAVSMVSLALNNAITNAAVARWAAHYFMSGAMPLLLVSTQDDPTQMTEADALSYKSLLERAWQGIWSKFALRAVFTDRKLDVQQAGIKAEDVQAPELNQDALNALASVFQIAPDLIVPPPGGSDNARHKFLIMDAYNSCILPMAKQFVSCFNNDFGFDENSKFRLTVNEEDIRALEAERADNADTELQIYSAGIQTYGETQERLRVRQGIDELAKFVMINGRFQSIESVLREDSMPSDRIFQYGPQAFDSGIVTRGEIRKLLFNLDTPPAQDGYKYEIVPDTTSGGAPLPQPGEGGATPALDSGAAPGGSPQLPSGGDQPPPEPPEPPDTPPSAPTPPPPGDGGGGAPKAPADAAQGGKEPEKKAEALPRTPDRTPVPDDDQEEDRFAFRNPASDQPDQKPVARGALPVQEQVMNAENDLSGALGVEKINTGLNVDVTPPAKEPMVGDPSAETVEVQNFYGALWIGDDPLIETVLKQLRPLVENLNVEWTDPADYHITLVYGDDCSEAQMQSIATMTPAQCPALHLRATNLVIFDAGSRDDQRGKRCIALAIEPDTDLEGLQSHIRAAVQAQGIKISPYSESAAYHPHVTLGYFKSDADVPEFACNLILEPKSLRLMRGDHQMVTERPSIANWRDWVDEKDTVEGDPAYSFDPTMRATREQMLADILRQRALMRSALEAWKTTGEPGPGLREQVRTAVREALARCGDDSERAWLAIMLACEEGGLDDEIDLEENPLQIPQPRAMQATPRAELDAWEKFTLHGKADRPFETLALPDALVDQVQTGLRSAKSMRAKRKVFAAARSALAETRAGATMATEKPAPRTNEAVLHDWAQQMAGDEGLAGLLES